MEYRTEHDAMGEVKVPADKYYGAQTERSRQNFPIGVGKEPMPEEIIRAFAVCKAAAAEANAALLPEKMTARKRSVIEQVCAEIADGKLDEHFPLVVFQTGSGTQSNMNVNEVICGRGNEIAGEKLLHPNDDANMSQSSNDTFPTAMHIAAAIAVKKNVIPAAQALAAALRKIEEENPDLVKCGRTHLQDAVPLRFADEVSGWRRAIEKDIAQMESSLAGVYELALGGTAVGTGLNAPAGFDRLAAESVAKRTGLPFRTADNKFYALTSKNALAFAHGALKALAADLYKIANDVRLLASGPRCGIGEIFIPENEPGSSIMPGKVNPTQCEAVTMVALQVMGNDTAIAFAAAGGNYELNVYMPLIAYNFLQSARLLTDVMTSFRLRCVEGIRPNAEKMKENLDKTLMTVTSLNPVIGYENAARVAHLAYEKNITLKEACVSLGFLSAEECDRILCPEKLI